ncbi:helix-turn-helix transcriptional regulator [Oerskovia sp. USHLN155]|uniref:helix-turn-helix transcriptional regulator n=1 Tax=Oerskovia sp. USHLN155 TaxID=3081288 RepID=UPI0030190893
MNRDERVGESVQVFRKARGLSQAQLAERMSAAGVDGMYPQTILKIEKGTRSLKFHEGLALAKILEVKPADLYDPTVEDVRGSLALLALGSLLRQQVALQGEVHQVLRARDELREKWELMPHAHAHPQREFVERLLSVPLADVVAAIEAEYATDRQAFGIRTTDGSARDQRTYSGTELTNQIERYLRRPDDGEHQEA